MCEENNPAQGFSSKSRDCGPLTTSNESPDCSGSLYFAGIWGALETGAATTFAPGTEALITEIDIGTAMETFTGPARNLRTAYLPSAVIGLDAVKLSWS